MIGFELKITNETGSETLYLSPGHSNLTGKVWIGREDGEGGEFDANALFAVIKKFYDDNF